MHKLLALSLAMTILTAPAFAQEPAPAEAPFGMTMQQLTAVRDCSIDAVDEMLMFDVLRENGSVPAALPVAVGRLAARLSPDVVERRLQAIATAPSRAAWVRDLFQGCVEQAAVPMAKEPTADCFLMTIFLAIAVDLEPARLREDPQEFSADIRAALGNEPMRDFVVSAAMAYAHRPPEPMEAFLGFMRCAAPSGDG